MLHNAFGIPIKFLGDAIF